MLKWRTLVACVATFALVACDAGNGDADSNSVDGAVDAGTGTDAHGEAGDTLEPRSCSTPVRCGEVARIERRQAGGFLHPVFEGDLLLGISGERGLEIFDVSGSSSILLSETSLETEAYARWLQVVDDVAFVGETRDFTAEDGAIDEGSAYFAYDISDPTSPRLLHEEVREDAGLASLCARHGSLLAFDFPRIDEVEVVDVSSPDSPRVVARLDRPEGQLSACALTPEALHVVGLGRVETIEEPSDAELWSYTLADGATPVISALENLSSYPYVAGLLAVDETHGVVFSTYGAWGDWTTERTHVRVVDPWTNPSDVWSFDIDEVHAPLAIDQGFLYLMQDRELVQMKLGTGATRSVEWPSPDGAGTWAGSADEGVIRVVGGDTVVSVDFSAELPSVVSTLSLNREENGNARDVLVRDGIAWVADEDGGVRIFELCADEPQRVGHLRDVYATRIKASDRWLLVFDDNGGTIDFYDIAEPRRPVHHARIGERTETATVQGERMILTDGAELAVFDLASDSPERAVGTVVVTEGTESEWTGMDDIRTSMHGDRALVARPPDFFEVDLSDPSAPTVLQYAYMEIGAADLHMTSGFDILGLHAVPRSIFGQHGETVPEESYLLWDWGEPLGWEGDALYVMGSDGLERIDFGTDGPDPEYILRTELLSRAVSSDGERAAAVGDPNLLITVFEEACE